MFKRAQRKLAKLRLGICGASGSGKTWSSLLIAQGIGGKIAMIDTERRGHLYAKDFAFDLSELIAPYSPERYIEQIKAAEEMGYDVLVIDSLSHAWVGEGGVLSIADRAGGTFQQGWRTATPKQNALMDSIITSNLHIIITLRSKTEWVVEPNEKGKMAPRKVGTAPIQRDGVEYEFTMFMDMNQEHYAHITKDNTKLYDQQIIKPTKEMGENIRQWLMDGKSAEEIFQEDLIKIEEKLKVANDVNELQSFYKEVVNEYPSLKHHIIPIAAKIKSQFNQQVGL